MRRGFTIVLVLCVVTSLGLFSQLDMLHGLSLPSISRRSPFSSMQAELFSSCYESGLLPPLRAGSTSIVAVSANRSASLLSVIPSWLAVRGVDEIVILEWGGRDPRIEELSAQNPMLRLVRAPAEIEWNLGRAYNLALHLSRGDLIFKVDADTWLSPEAVEAQPLGEHQFRRGCHDRALDANGKHLNGVMLTRRSDLTAVMGYDERMRGYGYDDTDLYARLSSARNLNSSCLSFAYMSHSDQDHADVRFRPRPQAFYDAPSHPCAHAAACDSQMDLQRGLTHIYHTLHRRATLELFKPWHESQLPPTSWQVLRKRAGSGGICELSSLKRPPFFDELLKDSDEMLLAHQEALQVGHSAGHCCLASPIAYRTAVVGVEGCGGLPH